MRIRNSAWALASLLVLCVVLISALRSSFDEFLISLLTIALMTLAYWLIAYMIERFMRARSRQHNPFERDGKWPERPEGYCCKCYYESIHGRCCTCGKRQGQL